MRVGDSNSAGRPQVGADRSSGSGASRVDRKSASASSGTSSGGKSSAAGSGLSAQLKEIPEVRAEVVAEVQQRLRDGDLLTREAAEQTAAAILSDLHGE